MSESNRSDDLVCRALRSSCRWISLFFPRPTMSESNRSDALLAYPTDCEEQTPLQTSSLNPPPAAAEHNQTLHSNYKYQPTPTEPPLGQQVQPTFFESLITLPSPPPNPFTGHPPSVGSQDMTPSATVVGCAVFPMDPSDLATMYQSPHCFVAVARACAEMSATEEVTPDHSTAERVSGRGLPLPRLGLPVVHGDGLDCTTVKDSVTG